MKKIIRLSLIAASLAVAGSAHALTLNTATGQHFTSDFFVTPDAANSLVLMVSGTAAQYSNLSFEFLSGGPAAVASLRGGNLIALFNDGNNPLDLSNMKYTLRIQGDTIAALPGGYGIVTISSRGGEILPVPESETYAMLLAGLGLMGTIISRRNKS